MSKIADYLWWLLPAVRKRKEKHESTLFGVLETIGTGLDLLKTVILMARLRRYFLVRDETDPYYLSEMRTADLDIHAFDRGIMRLHGEGDVDLLERLSTLAYRNQFLGTKAGMKYLVEEPFGLTCEQIVEYYADDQSWIIFSSADQSAETEVNISHVFSNDDVDLYEAYRQTRLYSASDLSLSFHFWIHISYQQGTEIDEEVIFEAINAHKPAHTRAVVHFTEIQAPVI
ncbi:MAG: hypothetical protein HN356_01455 [Calditrichaeota bacterium]|nr:hypothetical protein [Calditrichota bacterium]MBT7789864.1 hypothetical protein [Calditrichota bacterium]